MSLFVAAGVWTFYFSSTGKNGWDSVPVFWLFVLLCAPIGSWLSLVMMRRQKVSLWLSIPARLLMLPQGLVWLFAVLQFTRYL
jgi:hypothetical protein